MHSTHTSPHDPSVCRTSELVWAAPSFRPGARIGPAAHASVMHPSAALLTRSWQVAYVWAFIVKFGLLSRISSLLTLEEWVS